MAAHHLTSKVKENLCYLAERECVSIWHFSGAWPSDIWQQSAVILCSFRMISVHVYHLCKLCLCHSEGRTLPKLPLRDINIHGDWSRVFPGGMMVRGQLSMKDPSSAKETHPRRTDMPKQERGIPRHPWGSKQICSINSFVNWLCSQGEWTMQTFQSARGANFLFNNETTSSMLGDHVTNVGPHQVRHVSSFWFATAPLPIGDGPLYLDYIHV